MTFSYFPTTASYVTGPLHVKRGEECQDASAVLELGLNENTMQAVIAVVADGAGSLAHSKEGAETLCSLMVEKAASEIETIVAYQEVQDVGVKELDEDTLRAVLESAYRYAVETMQSEFFHFKEYGCTVSALIATPDVWVHGAVGDSLAIIDHGESKSLLTDPGNSEYANVTRLITSENNELMVTSGSTWKHVGMATDGLTGISVVSGVPFNGFWDYIFRENAQQTLLIGEIFDTMQRRGKLVDDTTLVVLTNPERTLET